MQIRMPVDFHDMDAGIIRLKYPSEDRPQIIKTSPYNDVDLTFSLLPDEVVGDDIAPLQAILKNAIRDTQPANEFYDDQMVLLPDQTEIGYFSFKSYTLSNKLYNLMFITMIDQRLLLGIFNCHFDDKEEWENIARQMMLSVQDLTKEGRRQS